MTERETEDSASTGPTSPDPPTEEGPSAEPGLSLSDAPHEALGAGDLVGRFSVERLLGIGGAGIVYAAHDPELDRTVALKVLRRKLADRPAARTRFLREAQALARLSHPNVISVYDVGVSGGRTFIAMEYIHGRTFGEWVASVKPGWKETVAVLIKAGRGLAAAHAAGLIHRDFKPANLLVGDDGRVLVTDFGLARVDMSSAGPAAGEGPDEDPMHRVRGGDLAEPLTRTGAMQGTPAYMAPEQRHGQPADARADQFSFCVTLYEAVFGARPLADEHVPSIPADGRSVPAWLQRAVLRGLSVRPDDRFPSMDRLLAALNREPMWRRRPVVSGGVLLLAGLVLAVALTSRAAEPDRRCTGAAAAYARTWNAERRRAVEAAFTASHARTAASALRQVVAAFDRHAARWTRAHTEACRATRILGEETEATLDLRMTCLQRRRQEAEALLSKLTAADAAVVVRSVEAALGLPDIGACDDIATLKQVAPLPGDPALRAKLEALTSRLADADSTGDTVSYAAALALARPILEEARRLGYRPFEAEAALLQGQLEAMLGERPGAEASFEATVWAAEAGRHDEIGARAWVHLVSLVGNEGAEYARGLAFVPRATAAIARLGGNAALEALLESALGSIDLSQSKVDSAIAHFEKSLALYEQARGAEHPETGRALDQLAAALLRRGDSRRAIPLVERALGIFERVLGPAHPHSARALEILAQAHMVAGDPARAEQEYRRALALREAIFDADHPEVVTNRSELADALRGQGRLEEALDIDRKQLGPAERAFGPEHPTFARFLMSFGLSLAQTGRYAEATEHLHRARAILTKLYGPDHDMVLFVRVIFGDILIAQSRWRDAAAAFEALLPAIEKAQEVRDAPQNVRVNLALAYIELRQPARALPVLEPLMVHIDRETPAWQGQIHFMWARALWNSRRDRKRAREHASAARAAFASVQLDDELTKVDRWLATHRAPRRPIRPDRR